MPSWGSISILDRGILLALLCLIITEGTESLQADQITPPKIHSLLCQIGTLLETKTHVIPTQPTRTQKSKNTQVSHQVYGPSDSPCPKNLNHPCIRYLPLYTQLHLVSSFMKDHKSSLILLKAL